MIRTFFTFLALVGISWATGYDQSASAASAHGTSISITSGGWSGACAAADTLVVSIGAWVAAATPPAINTPTMAGNTFTLINSTTNLVSGSSSSRVSTFYTTNIPGGSPAIAGTVSLTSYVDMAAECFAGFNTADQNNSNSELGSGNTLSTGNVTDNQPAEFFITWMFNQSHSATCAVSLGTVRVNIQDSSAGQSLCIGDFTETSPGTYAETWTFPSANVAAGLGSFFNISSSAPSTMLPTIQDPQ